jgi:hypothetical protein
MQIATKMMLFVIAIQMDEMESNNFIHSRYQKKFYRKLTKLQLQRRRRHRRIPRCALLAPKQSAWRRVYESGSDQALITMTGLDFETFHFIEPDFKYFYDRYSPYSKEGAIVALQLDADDNVLKGHPRLMSAADGLGLVLTWTRTRGSTMVLELIFGMTQTSILDYLAFCSHILINVLMGKEDAKIKRPAIEKNQEYKQAVLQPHPLLEDVWCTMDGLKLMLECAGDDVVQNRFYNGWTCDHYVGAVIVFCPDGTIPMCCYNVPGTVHDSNIAAIGNIYDKLGTIYNLTGGKCTVDSAFARNTYPFLIKSRKPSPDMTLDDIEVARDATSMRQSSEWGMRAFQSSFPRIKDRITIEYRGQRKLMMKLMIHLYNLRTRKVGINEILNVYMPALDEDVNQLYIN